MNRVQDSLQKQLNPVLKQRILNGALITGVALTTASAPVPHKLGRKYQGYWLVGQSANAVVWISDFAAPINPQAVINLAASAAVTVSLWVF
jgi:hypothetical protein